MKGPVRLGAILILMGIQWGITLGQTWETFLYLGKYKKPHLSSEERDPQDKPKEPFSLGPKNRVDEKSVRSGGWVIYRPLPRGTDDGSNALVYCPKEFGLYWLSGDGKNNQFYPVYARFNWALNSEPEDSYLLQNLSVLDGYSDPAAFTGAALQKSARLNDYKTEVQELLEIGGRLVGLRLEIEKGTYLWLLPISSLPDKLPVVKTDATKVLFLYPSHLREIRKNLQGSKSKALTYREETYDGRVFSFDGSGKGDVFAFLAEAADRSNPVFDYVDREEGDALRRISEWAELMSVIIDESFHRARAIFLVKETEFPSISDQKLREHLDKSHSSDGKLHSIEVYGDKKPPYYFLSGTSFKVQADKGAEPDPDTVNYSNYFLCLMKDLTSPPEPERTKAKPENNNQ